MQNHPQFFDKVPTIKTYDPLAQTLGSFTDGIIEFNYLQIVQAAGHSCPTVAGAYLITSKALDALYTNNEIPVRGNIRVEFKEDMKFGVAGVIANVVSNITGATEFSGFKGLNGNFVRHGLLSYNSNTNASAKFTRTDTNETVEVYYNPASVKPDSNMNPLMQKVMSGMATENDKKEFGVLWQKRVEDILINNFNNTDVIKAVSI